MKKFQIYFYLLIIFGVFFVFNFYQVDAEEGVPERGIQISPTKIPFELKTGTEGRAVINVKNYDKNLTHDIEVQVEDFYVENNSADIQYFIPDENHDLKAYDVINWIEVEKNFTLAPNESKNVEFKIKIPENVPTGGYYGAILFKTSENKSNNNSQTNIDESYRASVLLNIAVLGKEPVVLKGELLQFFPKSRIFFGDQSKIQSSLKEKFFNWSGSGNLVTHIKNSGNIHFKIKGDIEIYKFGSHYKTINLKEQFVYPSKIRIFNNQFNFRWWDFGIYRADIKLSSVDEKINLNKESVYWIVFPWKTFLVIILFLFANYLERKWTFKKKQDR